METYIYNINKENISINKKELARRLGTPCGYTDTVVEECIKKVTESCTPVCCYAQVPVVTSAEGTADVGFAAFESRDLCKNLSGCARGYVVALTLGIETDRLIARLGISSETKGYVADAVASAVAESVMDNVAQYLGQRHRLSPPFSPGYGDLSLSCQREILGFLSADRLLGIKLTESLLMVPSKSITAICGIKE